jgi:ribosomal protein L40E
MAGQPPQLRDQAALRSGLRVGGGVLFGIGLVITVIALADFFGTVGTFTAPTKFWMAFVGLPLIAIGVWMMQAGFLGVATRYVAGEVSPTIKDALSYAGVGTDHAVCAKCGATNRAEAKFCDDCGAALSVTCASCGHVNAADATFCDECGKPVTPA